MKTALTIFLVTVIGTILHEIAHLLAALSFGYDATININSVQVLSEATVRHSILISAAGPAFTIALGVFGFVMVNRSNSMLGFNILVAAALHRSAAAIISAISAPNDEMSMSLLLGLGSWTVFAIVLLALWGMVVYAAKKMQPSWSYVFWAWLGISLGMIVVVFGENFIPTIQLGS